MANAETMAIWQKIQQGVKETERLIGRKEYNLSMIKARQTLEFMVRSMAEQACIVDSELADTIDQLYESRYINRATMEHYHTIRILGNRAVHEGDNMAYDATQSYHLLSQEAAAFVNELHNQRNRRPRPAPAGGGRHKKRNAKRKKGIRPDVLLKFLIPVLCVVFLIVLIKVLMPEKKEQPDETTQPVTVETSQPETEPAEPTTQPTETEPTEESTEAVILYKTTTTLNVRKEPSKDSSILVQLPPDTEVEYVKRYNKDWTVINYDGQESYVASQYLKKE